jgi:DNA invertase Pin-like site-specific DNA recombinase
MAKSSTEVLNPRVIGYVRVSTEEQAVSDAGLEAQRGAIRLECERRNWVLLAIHEDAGLSGKSFAGRPALREALALLRTGTANVLCVAKLDRLSRSLLDVAELLKRSEVQGWRFLALDVFVDTTVPHGALVAHILASFAEYERKLIGQRTKDALAVKRANGVRLGRPPTISAELLSRIRHQREQGATLQALAHGLNDDGVPTLQGGKQWYPATVRRVLMNLAQSA